VKQFVNWAPLIAYARAHDISLAVTEFGGHPTQRCGKWLTGFLQAHLLYFASRRRTRHPLRLSRRYPRGTAAADARGGPVRARQGRRADVAAVERVPSLVVVLDHLAGRPLRRLRAGLARH
jgi:hypothetical protein